MSKSDRLRVLVLSRSYPNDVLPHLGLWVERPVQLLAAHCDIRVVAPSPWCPPVPGIEPLRQYARFRRIPRRELRDGIQVERPRFPTGPGRSLYALDARTQALTVSRTVDRLHAVFPFDLIHAQMIYPEGVVAQGLGRRFGVPFVVTEHAPWTENWFRSRSLRRQAVDAGRASAALLAVSTSVRESIVSYGIDPGRVRVTPVGVDTQRFELGPAEARRRDQVLFVGWPNYTKGLDVLLDAIAILAERGSPARLLVVGGALYRDTRLQEEKLRRYASSLGLDDRVHFLGPKAQGEVARLMAESAVLVLPSRAESFGAVLVEALACGTPVVGTRSGGPEDIVTPDVGMLVPVGDERALADAIRAVLDDPDRYPPEALRESTITRFGWPSIVARTLDIYREVT